MVHCEADQPVPVSCVLRWKLTWARVKQSQVLSSSQHNFLPLKYQRCVRKQTQHYIISTWNTAFLHRLFCPQQVKLSGTWCASRSTTPWRYQCRLTKRSDRSGPNRLLEERKLSPRCSVTLPMLLNGESLVIWRMWFAQSHYHRITRSP